MEEQECSQSLFLPTRLLCPWDSPGETGVGCHFLLQEIFPTQASNPGLLHCRQILYHLSHQGSPKNTGVGCHALLQGMFPTQGLNPDLLHCRWILYQLGHKGSPKCMVQFSSVQFSSVAQSCPTLCNSMDCRPPGSSVYGIFQARILERASIPFSRGYSQPRDQTQVSCIAGSFFTV